MGESANAATDTAHCETLKHPSIYNSGEQKLRTSFAETRKTTKQMNQTALTGSEVAQKVAQVEDRAMSAPPSVRLKVPTELSGFFYVRLPHAYFSVSVSFTICLGVSHQPQSFCLVVVAPGFLMLTAFCYSTYL